MTIRVAKRVFSLEAYNHYVAIGLMSFIEVILKPLGSAVRRLAPDQGSQPEGKGGQAEIATGAGHRGAAGERMGASDDTLLAGVIQDHGLAEGGCSVKGCLDAVAGNLEGPGERGRLPCGEEGRVTRKHPPAPAEQAVFLDPELLIIDPQAP